MRTCFLHLQSKNHRWLRRLSCLFLLALGTAASAQTLARPGWAGSGVAIEPWWRRAVFYRINPANFQDSDGDGKGDLAGITQRLGYLQSLGVDAIILRLAPISASPELQSGFEDLARTAAEHKLRVLVELTPSDASGTSAETYLNAARFWLNQGAAGIDLNSATLAAAGDEQAAALVHSLHELLRGFPGGRILVANAAPVGDPVLAKALSQSVQLVAAKPLVATTSATALRTEMEAALGNESASPAPAHTTSRRHARAHEAEPANLLWSASSVEETPNISAEQRLALQRTMAMLLLASRAAVVIDYGEEIGLHAGADSPMQWTPKNVTPHAAAPIERQATVAPADRPIPPKPKQQSNVYGAYVPYVPSAKAKPLGTPETDTPAKVDPNTLPGFTSGTLPGSLNADAATVNVAVEDTDPHSLLNLYRKLIQLHHGNASIHNGAETLLKHDDLNALLWVRHPPPGATTAATVVALCNLSAKPLDISLAEELKLRAGTFHTLAGDAKISGDRISVAPGAVWLGEWRK